MAKKKTNKINKWIFKLMSEIIGLPLLNEFEILQILFKKYEIIFWAIYKRLQVYNKVKEKECKK